MARRAIVWRIARHTTLGNPTDMSGEAAKDNGGRWNSIGSAVVYSSTTIALAALETLTRFSNADTARNSFLVRVEVPYEIWRKRKTTPAASLPVTWLSIPAAPTSIDFGDAWLAARSEAIMLVPSVIIPEEFNVMINPRHPEAGRITASVQRPFLYDPRLK